MLTQEQASLVGDWIKSRFTHAKKLYPLGARTIKHDCEREFSFRIRHADFQAAMIDSGFAPVYQESDGPHYYIKETPKKFHAALVQPRSRPISHSRLMVNGLENGEGML